MGKPGTANPHVGREETVRQPQTLASATARRDARCARPPCPAPRTDQPGRDAANGRDMKSKSRKIDTLLTHAGRDPANHFGTVNPPVYHASTILYPTVK